MANYTPREKTCVQCGTVFTPSKANHNCVRCAGCRNFKNGAVPVVCGRCGIKLQINAAIYYSRITKKIEADGIYICSPCKHAIRSRRCKALAKGREVVPEVRETVEVPCGHIMSAPVMTRCAGFLPGTHAESAYFQVGEIYMPKSEDGCPYYEQCLGIAAKRNWDGFEATCGKQNTKQWYAKHYPGTRQLCSICEEPTGRCKEDSIYAEDGTGPLCESCAGLTDA